MGYMDYGYSFYFIQMTYGIHYLAASRRVEHRRAFVENYTLSVHRYGSGDRDPLLLPPGQALRGVSRILSLIPTVASALSTRLRISSLGIPRFSGPNATSSSTIVATI